MFDIEKMMKPIFEKHIPSIVETFEKNKKRDWIMTQLNAAYLGNATSAESKIKMLSDAYDEAQAEMKKQGIIK